MIQERENPLLLDLNNPVFQRQFFSLQKSAQVSILSTFRKLMRMTWEQVHADRGLKWEAILSRKGPHGDRLYSFRIGKGFRGSAYREGNFRPAISPPTNWHWPFEFHQVVSRTSSTKKGG